MNSAAFQNHVLKNHRGFAIFCVLMITLLEYIIISIMTTFDTASMYSSLMDQLPERFRMLLSDNYFPQMTVDGAAAFGFNHPIVLVMIAALAISIPARHISDAIEDGTMEWLLAQPVNRSAFIGSLWMSGCVLLLIIIAGGLLGLFSALAVNHSFTPAIFSKMLQIGANLWLLFIFIMSMTMMVASFGKPGCRTGTIGAAVVLTFYVLYFFASIWEWFSFSKPFNFFSYYQPQQLMFDRQSFSLNAAVLSGLITVCLILSLLQFRRRDIPG
jgi:ABC-type transport system involved in multi-copper enzyme maturation permease subunit